MHIHIMYAYEFILHNYYRMHSKKHCAQHDAAYHSGKAAGAPDTLCYMRLHISLIVLLSHSLILIYINIELIQTTWR